MKCVLCINISRPEAKEYGYITYWLISSRIANCFEFTATLTLKVLQYNPSDVRNDVPLDDTRVAEVNSFSARAKVAKELFVERVLITQQMCRFCS